MFVLQDNKIYIIEKNELIGVSIYQDKILKVKDSKETLKENHVKLTPFEVKTRLNIREDNPYIFPQSEVVKDDKPTGKTKKTTGTKK